MKDIEPQSSHAKKKQDVAVTDPLHMNSDREPKINHLIDTRDSETGNSLVKDPHFSSKVTFEGMVKVTESEDVDRWQLEKEEGGEKLDLTSHAQLPDGIVKKLVEGARV